MGILEISKIKLSGKIAYDTPDFFSLFSAAAFFTLGAPLKQKKKGNHLSDRISFYQIG
jgi:hypothetical protein